MAKTVASTRGRQLSRLLYYCLSPSCRCCCYPTLDKSGTPLEGRFCGLLHEKEGYFRVCQATKRVDSSGDDRLWLVDVDWLCQTAGCRRMVRLTATRQWLAAHSSRTVLYPSSSLSTASRDVLDCVSGGVGRPCATHAAYDAAATAAVKSMNSWLLSVQVDAWPAPMSRLRAPYSRAVSQPSGPPHLASVCSSLRSHLHPPPSPPSSSACPSICNRRHSPHAPP